MTTTPLTDEQRIASLEVQLVTTRVALKAIIEDANERIALYPKEEGQCNRVRVMDLGRSALSASTDYKGKVVMERTTISFLHLVMNRALSSYPSLELVAGFTESIARLDSLRQGGEE